MTWKTYFPQHTWLISAIYFVLNCSYMYHAIVQGHLKVSSKEHKFCETIYSKLYFTCIALLLNILSKHPCYLLPAHRCSAFRLQFGTFLPDWIARFWKYCLIHSRLRTVCLSAFLFFFSLSLFCLLYDISSVQQDKWAKLGTLTEMTGVSMK